MFKRIFESINTRVIGKFPQVEQTIEPDYVHPSEFLGNYRHAEAPPDVLVPIPLLVKRAKKLI